MVRSRLPDATIVSFWHVPWLTPQRMSLCPWLAALVNGLLGSDIVGFQTPEHRRNFTACVPAGRSQVHLADSSGATESLHRIRVRDYPISIAWPTAAEKAEWPSIGVARQQAAARFDLPSAGRLIVGIDRFDYTKGLLERLHAVEHLLAMNPCWRGRLRFVQVAAPTRTAVAEYAGFRAQVLAAAQRINHRFAADGPPPVRLLDMHHDHAAVNALYRAADVCLVTSLHDGMNLVCKEFVAARDDEQGVLVLSRYAGASHELSQALVVDPHRTADVAVAIHRALTMPADEQRRRMKSLRATVEERNVYRWAASMLLDVGAVRRARRAKVHSASEDTLATGTG
jgi:trehalose 6-phosphate synthase